MPQFKSINFCYNRPKIKLFLHKNCKISARWGLRPQTPLPPAVGGVVPKPPMASCDRDYSYLIDNLFVVIFYCLFDVFSTLALVKCLLFDSISAMLVVMPVRTVLKVPLEKAAPPCPFDVPAPLSKTILNFRQMKPCFNNVFMLIQFYTYVVPTVKCIKIQMHNVNLSSIMLFQLPMSMIYINDCENF